VAEATPSDRYLRQQVEGIVAVLAAPQADTR
jgi:hypothetical protein